MQHPFELKRMLAGSWGKRIEERHTTSSSEDDQAGPVVLDKFTHCIYMKWLSRENVFTVCQKGMSFFGKELDSESRRR